MIYISFISAKDILFEIFLKIITAIITILLGFIIGRVLGVLIEKILIEFEASNFIYKITKLRIKIEKIIGFLVSYSIYVTAIILALDKFGLADNIIKIFFGIIIAILVVSLILSMKDFIINLMSGIIIRYNGKIKIGKEISLKKLKGKVIRTSLVNTYVQTKENDVLVVPNINFINEK